LGKAGGVCRIVDVVEGSTEDDSIGCFYDPTFVPTSETEMHGISYHIWQLQHLVEDSERAPNSSELQVLDVGSERCIRCI